MEDGIFRDFENTKAAAPGWTRKLPRGLRQRLVELYWLRNDVRDFVADFTGHVPGHGLRLFIYRRILGVQIGPKTSLHRGCRIYAPAGVSIGAHSVINRDVLLDGRARLVIGENVSISEGVMLLSLEHDPNSPSFAARGARVVIEDYVFIGARAIVLPGVRMMHGSVAASGAVVTRDVPPCQIVAGVPARPVGERNADLHYCLDYRKFLG